MIRKDIFNRDIKSRFKAAARDRLHRFSRDAILNLLA
jgi:hypothetical protein